MPPELQVVMAVSMSGRPSLTPHALLVSVSEGLAVGVGFGAVEKTASATFESAR